MALLAESNRGVIRNRRRASQLVDFSGLRYGKITPTDLDGLIEYKNTCFVLYEFKHESHPYMDIGQSLAITRLCDGLSKPYLFVLATHNKAPEIDIPASYCNVVDYYTKGEWRAPKEPINAGDLTDLFLIKYSNIPGS